MRTDWNFTVLAFTTRSSVLGSIGALENQYLSSAPFSIQTTKPVVIDARTTNVFVGIDSSSLYVGQDLFYVPGIIYPNTKILEIVEGRNVISAQSIPVGISTTILTNVNTSGITTQTKISLSQNVIADGTSIVSVGTSSLQIFPPSLNFAGIATRSLSFYNGSGEYSLTLSARTTNSFEEFINLDFGTGSVTGIGSTFIFNTDAYYGSGGPITFVGDELGQTSGIITTGYSVTGIDTYTSSSTTNFNIKTEIDGYKYLEARTYSVNVGSISSLVAIGDYVRGPYFTSNTTVTSISGSTVSFGSSSTNTYALISDVGFTRPVSVSEVSNVININTTGIFVGDYVVSAVLEPNTYVVSVGVNSITLNNPTINGAATVGSLGITTNIITGISTSRLEVGLGVAQIPGIIPSGTTITGFVKQPTIIGIQTNVVGVQTTRLYGLDTTNITTQSKLSAVSGIIAQGTYVKSIFTTFGTNETFDSELITFDSENSKFDSLPVRGYVEIFPASLNTAGIGTTTSLTFFSETVNVQINNFTQNSTPIPSQLLNLYLDVSTEFAFGQYSTVQNQKNRIYFNKSGINTAPISSAGFTFGYTGPVSKITTAQDYGDLLNVTFSQQNKSIGINTNIIGINTSLVSIGQFIKPVTEVFDNESGTFIESILEGAIKTNVGTSNTTTTLVNFKLGNLITKESKKYTFDTFDSYTIQFLSQFQRAFVTQNTSVFPAYANPPGSIFGDPSLRYTFTSFPTDWDINKVLGIKNFPYDVTARERAAARGRRSYGGPFYPRHVFGR
jgi:hypothetical protein